MLELLTDEVLVISELLSEALLVALSVLMTVELSLFSVGTSGILTLNVLSIEMSDILLVIVDKLSAVSFEFDNIGGAAILDGSFAQAASVTAIAITGMILHNLFMFTLLRVDCPYHSCGNTANYCQRRNVMCYHGSCRDNCPIAYCNSRKYCCVRAYPYAFS